MKGLRSRSLWTTSAPARTRSCGEMCFSSKKGQTRSSFGFDPAKRSGYRTSALRRKSSAGGSSRKRVARFCQLKRALRAHSGHPSFQLEKCGLCGRQRRLKLKAQSTLVHNPMLFRVVQMSLFQRASCPCYILQPDIKTHAGLDGARLDCLTPSRNDNFRATPPDRDCSDSSSMQYFFSLAVSRHVLAGKHHSPLVLRFFR
jgi:hypothetical protein